MKENTIKVLDDEDIEFANILHSLGMQCKVAVIVTYLTTAGEASSREIEQATHMSQPEVCLTMRDLRGENWIDERKVTAGGKGRPSLVYTLREPVDDIIKWVEDEKLREHAEAMESIQKLRGLVSSWHRAAEPS
ncbi:MAG: ArsR family transcriptional regulator [Methanothrix sp.]